MQSSPSHSSTADHSRKVSARVFHLPAATPDLGPVSAFKRTDPDLGPDSGWVIGLQCHAQASAPELAAIGANGIAALIKSFRSTNRSPSSAADSVWNRYLRFYCPGRANILATTRTAGRTDVSRPDQKTHSFLRGGDGCCSQDAIGLIIPLSRQYRATESSIIGSSPNKSFCFWLSWLI